MTLQKRIAIAGANQTDLYGEIVKERRTAGGRGVIKVSASRNSNQAGDNEWPSAPIKSTSRSGLGTTGEPEDMLVADDPAITGMFAGHLDASNMESRMVATYVNGFSKLVTPPNCQSLADVGTNDARDIWGLILSSGSHQ